MTENNYTSSSIKVLKGLEAVKLRPAMYIGSTDEKGLHHLVWEVVDNSIDEHLAGHGTKIKVGIHKDGSISVLDNGRGIPTDMHPEEGKTGVELALTVLHAGGKFDKESYQVSGGLHGVGVSCVNALSEWLKVYIKQKGKIFYQEFKEGFPQTELQVLGISDETGTQVTFLPNKNIFSTIVFNFETLKKRLRELAFLNPGLEIILLDERTANEITFNYQEGLRDFINFLNEGKGAIGNIIELKKEQEKVIVEVALQYNESYTQIILSYVNNIN